MVAAGWSFCLLAIFYAVIDVIGWKRWAWFFVIIGMNAITIYMAQAIIPFESIAEFFLKGIAGLNATYGVAIMALGVLIIKWCCLWFLYRHQVFLRV
jgi:predicted acyltransferase